MEGCFGLCGLVWENLQGNIGKHSGDALVAVIWMTIMVHATTYTCPTMC